VAINLAFFGLTREPFSPAPDPTFLYLSPTHDEALAQLVYGVTERKAFVLLTGEIGTGKTTLLRALMQRVGDRTGMAFVTHSGLSFEGIVECIMNGFGIAKPGQSLAQQLLALQAYLADGARAGQNAVIILDEAQNLSPETLEQIRLLSNLETASEKLLQIVLAGQPEVARTLAQPALRQFEQRIALRCTVSPLNPAETRDYIHARLRMAGAATTNTFTDEAIERIARWTRGIPRMINNVCDHCLVIGYAEQVRRIDRKIADEAIRYFERATGSARRRGGWPSVPRRAIVWASGAGVAAAAAVAAAHLDIVHALTDFARSMRDLVIR
jgi:general secretion pathway protein A